MALSKIADCVKFDFFHPYLDILQHNAASSFVLVFHQLQIE